MMHNGSNVIKLQVRSGGAAILMFIGIDYVTPMG